MGSSSVMHLVKDDDLHVAYEQSRHRPDVGKWWVVGKDGSYGGSPWREVAVDIAMSASATGSGGRRRIHVHHADGRLAYTITRLKHYKATSQFFQDAVP